MYVEKVPNRNSPPAILLREATRDGKRVLKRTIANISHWPEAQIEALRRVLKGENMVPADAAFSVLRSLPHGHVQAVLATIHKLGFDKLLAVRRSGQRDLVIAMIIEQIIHPCSKLATTRLWHTTTLAEEMQVTEADENDLYGALDWLLSRQGVIEKKLSARHLHEGATVLYDVSSSYYEGHKCSLARFGHSKDRKRGKPIIVYGVMTDAVGRPVAVEVYPGNTGDPSTVADQVDKLRNRFGLSRVLLAGDRGMLTQSRIETLRGYPGLGWISALRSKSIRTLVEDKHLQMSLFDTQNLAEISSPDYPGERLIACMNPFLKEQRRLKREELLTMTEKVLNGIGDQVDRRKKKILGKGEIGVKVGRVINRYKMAKHFKLFIEDGHFHWERNEVSIDREAALDGIYVIRTSESSETLSAADTVRTYKSLSQVERLFRTLKGVDLRIRPIRHHTEDHVRAHILLCMLAYYIEWHMREAWSSLLFDDEELGDARKTRDPVLPAQPSISAKSKKTKRVNAEGYPVHSFETLLEELATFCRNRCVIKSSPGGAEFDQLTQRTALQQRALDLLECTQ